MTENKKLSVLVAERRAYYNALKAAVLRLSLL